VTLRGEVETRALICDTPPECLLLTLAHLSELDTKSLALTCQSMHARITACVYQHGEMSVSLLWLAIDRRLGALPQNQRGWYPTDETAVAYIPTANRTKTQNTKVLVGMGITVGRQSTAALIAARITVAEDNHPLIRAFPRHWDRLRDRYPPTVAAIHSGWHRLSVVSALDAMEVVQTHVQTGIAVGAGNAPMAHGRHVLHWVAPSGFAQLGIRRFFCTGGGQGSVRFPAGKNGDIVHGRRLPPPAIRSWHADERGPAWIPPSAPFDGKDPRNRNRTVIARPYARPGQRVYALLDFDIGTIEIYVNGERLGIASSGIYGVVRWDARASGESLEALHLVCGQRATELLERDIARAHRNRILG
jgi:hypothetical protein